jgi:hypothetical protein
MRKEIYNAIVNTLKEKLGDKIQHFDLWNSNVDFIEQEDNWARPAVFIQFLPIEWKAIATGFEYRAEVAIKLHIVTDWSSQEDTTAAFELSEEICDALIGLDGNKFKELDIVESYTNHNHEEIMETVDVYECVGFKHLIMV